MRNPSTGPARSLGECKPGLSSRAATGRLGGSLPPTAALSSPTGLPALSGVAPRGPEHQVTVLAAEAGPVGASSIPPLMGPLLSSHEFSDVQSRPWGRGNRTATSHGQEVSVPPPHPWQAFLRARISPHEANLERGFRVLGLRMVGE